jgi:tetratricopeptide repeat protein
MASVEPPEKIPLDEAVSRDLIPCSVCGAQGAEVRQVEGKKHFLCPACQARGRRWRWALVVVVAAGAGLFLYLRTRAPGPSSDPAQSLEAAVAREEIERQIVDLMKQGKYREVRAQVGAILAQIPGDPMFNLYMGQCSNNLGYFADSVRFFQIAMAGDPKFEKECRSSLGQALQFLGHSARAAPFLEKSVEGTPPDHPLRFLLAECYVDLERYDDARKVLEALPAQPLSLRLRNRILLYQGKPDDARKVLDAPDAPGGFKPLYLSMQAREEGDFAAALALLQDAGAKADPKSFDAIQYRRMALMVYIESGDLDKLAQESGALAKLPQRQLAGEALYYRTLGLLLAGKREEAVTSAKEFLASVDVEKGSLRTEVLLMQHLAGTRKSEDLTGEVAQLNRFRANDVYFYLALESGKKEWAQKALEATPGHNFPYHAIRRLLKN